MILGNSGSGKSTLARELGAKLCLPIIHLDQLFWNPGWHMSSHEEFVEKQRHALDQASDGWVCEGNYFATAHLRLPKADTVIVLDVPRALCLWRVLKRWALNKGNARADGPRGCPDKMDMDFIRWIWGYPRHSLPLLERAIELDCADKRVVRLASHAETERFLVSRI